ncbi:hypothetical protein O3P69_009329 [Scylla paramamosain]|uniref:Probable arginine--tRNA ligase, mitochondrial n=1 Tax=Scylla paramamosain TaxID=85552 RepID=A0AAW0TAP9_SCYPA
MAHKIRSLISNKVVQALESLPSRGKEVKASAVLPYIQVDPQTSQPPEFRVSLRDLYQRSIISSDGHKGLVKVGSSLTRADIRLNFKVNSSQLVSDVVKAVTERPINFWRKSGLVSLLPPQRVVVEYSSPNIAKPFHVGHLRSTIIGSFVANVNQAVGHEVIRINFLGDWGTQFGLLKYGYDHQNLTASDLEEDAIAKLHRAYVWANQRAAEDPTVAQTARETFTRMEEGHPGELSAWETFRTMSIRDLKRVYARLNVTFDEYHGESMYPKNACRRVLKDMEHSGLIRTAGDGRKVYQYGFTRMYYVVENGQSDHFSALFSILAALGHPWADCLTHIKFGRVRGMSSRKGTAVGLEDLLDGARQLMGHRQDLAKTTKREARLSSDTAEELAVSSVIVGDLKQRRQRDYEFSWDKALQATGDTGVEATVHPLSPGDTAALVEPTALALVKEIARFDEVLVETYHELEACVLLAYLFRLCSVTNAAFKQLQIKGAQQEVAEARLALFLAARHTLAAGMTILGLRPMQHM